MKATGWELWEINQRGELYHTERPDLVFTAADLEGLHFYHQKLAAERAALREEIERLQANLPPVPPSNIVIFPRYTRQRP